MPTIEAAMTRKKLIWLGKMPEWSEEAYSTRINCCSHWGIALCTFSGFEIISVRKKEGGDSKFNLQKSRLDVSDLKSQRSRVHVHYSSAVTTTKKKASELNESRGWAKTRPPMQTPLCLFASFQRIQWSQVLCGLKNSVGEIDSYGDCWGVPQKHGFLIYSLRNICHFGIPLHVTLNQRHT